MSLAFSKYALYIIIIYKHCGTRLHYVVTSFDTKSGQKEVISCIVKVSEECGYLLPVCYFQLVYHMIRKYDSPLSKEMEKICF